MKNFLFLLIIFVLSGCCFNTNKKDEAHDFLINDTLLRSELITYDLENQKEIFRALTPEMKFKLYDYKYKVDLSSDKLTDKEKQILKMFKDELVTLQTFPNNEGISEEVENQWIEKFKKELNWSEDHIYMYSMTFLTAEEFLKFVEQNNL